MFSFPIQYQACFFSDFGDVKPSSEILGNLLKVFEKEELLPATFHEFAIFPTGIPKAIPRIMLASTNQEWIIKIEGHRINIEKNKLDSKVEGLGEMSIFANVALDYINRLLKVFDKKGTRLSIVTVELLKEMSPDELMNTYSQVFHVLPFYKTNPPDTWLTNSVSRIPVIINGKNDMLNVIVEIARIQGEFAESSLPFDRIQIKYDINTHQSNQSARFSSDSLSSFLDQALEIRLNLISMCKELIHE